MDDDFAVGDTVVLRYLNRFGRYAVANGPVVELDNDNIAVQVGRVVTRVQWDSVVGLRIV